MTRDSKTDDPTGVVLAGGYSQRFGERDKALARLDGRSLLARVVVRLAAVAKRVVINCRADQRDRFKRALDGVPVPVPVAFVTDPLPDRGPLFGFRAALRAVETETCALAACDAPFLDPRLLTDLTERLNGRTDTAGESEVEAVALRTEGYLHPTQALYRTDPTEVACETLLDADETRLSALLDRLDYRAVPAESAAGNVTRSLFDVNTPTDRERAVEMLRAESLEEPLDEVAPSQYRQEVAGPR